MSTIHDVAKMAKVSTTTVSHVINGTRYVSDELKLRVLDSMRSLDYQPNGLARSLRVGKSKTIGLIVPDNSNSFFAEISRYVENFGYQNGYSVILCNTDDDPEKEDSYINMLINKQVDGIMFISACTPTSNISHLVEMNVPVIVVDRELAGSKVDTVVTDNLLGGTLAGNYLLSLGHQQFACISGGNSVLSSQQRVEGFTQALHKANIELRPEYLLSGDFHFQSGVECMDRFIEIANQVPANERPTALFVCNDVMALGVIRSAHEHGMHMPVDFSIIGYDNIQITEFVSPPLTTIAQPTQELAETATRILLQRIARGSTQNRKPQRIFVNPYLVKRESCIMRHFN